MAVFYSDSAACTEQFAQDLAKRLQRGAVLALFGGLGMGKTTFVRGLARGLDASDPVSSPTFALVHVYDARIPIVHFDMYRIHTPDDLYSTGFYDYIDSGAVLVIEWPEHIEPYLPPDTIRIYVERGKTENDRRFTVPDAYIGD